MQLKLFLIPLILLLSLHDALSKPDHARINIEQGFINIDSVDLTNSGIIKLSGDWKFFPGKFIQNYIDADTSKYMLVKVPGIWNDYPQLSNRGFGSYYLKIVRSNNNRQSLAMRFKSAGVAFKVFINGELSYQAGVPGKTKEMEQPHFKPGILPLKTDKDTIDVIVWISNFHHQKGGLWKYIWLGEEETVREELALDYYFDWFLIGCLLFMGLFHMGIYISSQKEISNLVFGILNLIFVMRIGGGANSNMFYANYFGLSFNTMIFIEYFTFYLGTFVFISYNYLLFPKNIPKKVFQIALIVVTVFLIPVLFTEPIFYTRFPLYHRVYAVIMFGVLIAFIVKALFKSKVEAIIFFIGFSTFAFTIIVDILIASHVVFFKIFSPIGILVFTISQSFLLTRRFSESLKRSELLTIQLEYQNKNQEIVIKERTSEIIKQKEEIEKNYELIGRAYEEIKQQHSLLFQQKKEIELYNINLNSAIRYAQKIQNALMPDQDRIRKYFNDYFIIYKPKDVVSGDFYWIREKNNKLLLAVADCTGHGVPGAFMSMLGISLLTEATNNVGLSNPGEVLSQLPALLKNLIMLDESNSNGFGDGMEIALVLFDKKKEEIVFSSARMDILLVRENELIEIKSDRNRLCWGQNYCEYKNQTIPIRKGDMLYIYTDGYPDQLGGYPRKKFTTTKLKKDLQRIHQYSIAEQQDYLLNRIEKWMKSYKNQVDDVTFWGIRF